MVERQSIPEAFLGYNVRFDITDHRNLNSQRASLPPEEYKRRSDQLNLRIEHNLQTMLGERFNVEISRVQYQIVDQKLQSPDHDEPFLEIIKRGQKFRQEHGSQETARELAEVYGLAKVQEILATANQLPGTKVIIISPRGLGNSIYRHNFCDVYTKAGDGTITMSRFTSKLSYDRLRQAAAIIDPLTSFPQTPSDADFLANPLVTRLALPQIQSIFSPQEKVMSNDKYQKLLDACGFLISTYINCLANGTTAGEIQKVYNAILNFADVWPNAAPMPTANQTISHYGILPVRQVAAGCGLQTGSGSQNYSPWSVSEFAAGNEWFTCPKCNYKANGPVGDTCPNCHLTKEEYAKEAAVC